MRINIKKLNTSYSLIISTILFASLMARLHHYGEESLPQLIIIGAVILLTTIIATRESSQYSLYGRPTVMPMSLILAIISLLIEPSEAMRCSFAALFMTLSYSSFNSAVQSYNDTTSQLFCSALWCGMVAVTTPSAAVLIVPLILAVFFFERIKREYFVAVVGFVLPTLFYIYWDWLMGDGSMLEHAKGYFATAYHQVDDTITLRSVKMWVIALSALVALLSSSMVSRLSIKSISRSRINNNSMWVIFGLMMFFVPCFAEWNFILFASAIAITLTALMFELKGWIATIIYIATVVAAIYINVTIYL